MFRKILLLSFLCCALLCIVVFVPRSQITDILPELKRCNEKICFFSIVPNITSIDQAMTMLRQSPEFKEVKSAYAESSFVHSNPEYQVSILASEGKVFGIDIGSFKQPLSMWELSVKLNERPCGVNLNYGSPTSLLLGYPDIGVYIDSKTHRVMPNSTVLLIMLRESIRNDCPPEGQINHATISGSTRAWHGFGAYWEIAN